MLTTPNLGPKFTYEESSAPHPRLSFPGLKKRLPSIKVDDLSRPHFERVSKEGVDLGTKDIDLLLGPPSQQVHSSLLVPCSLGL